MSIIFELKLLSSLVISFLVTYFSIPFLCTVAPLIGAVDVPDGKLKKHEKIVPYLGGIAVFVGFLAAVTLIVPFEKWLFIFLLGTTILLGIGLIDDFFMIRPYQKFSGQILAALYFLKAGLYLKKVFFHMFWHIPISFFWILSVINAFNLVDVMDGLSSILAIHALFSFLVIALLFGQQMIALLLCALLGALIAFFIYNKPPAKIYLGDAGSLFIGGCLAVMPFVLNWSTYNLHGYLASMGILGVILLEGLTLIIIRLYKGIPFYLGSPHHFSIYLQERGWSKKKILYYSFSMASITSIISLLFAFNYLKFVHVAICAILFLVIWFYILFKY